MTEIYYKTSLFKKIFDKYYNLFDKNSEFTLIPLEYLCNECASERYIFKFKRILIKIENNKHKGIEFKENYFTICYCEEKFDDLILDKDGMNLKYDEIGNYECNKCKMITTQYYFRNDGWYCYKCDIESIEGKNREIEECDY